VSDKTLSRKDKTNVARREPPRFRSRTLRHGSSGCFPRACRRANPTSRTALAASEPIVSGAPQLLQHAIGEVADYTRDVSGRGLSSAINMMRRQASGADGDLLPCPSPHSTRDRLA
jgi:hypothetical protein